MAIQYDSSAQGTGSGGTATVAHTCSLGSAVVLIVAVISTGNTTPSGVTYAGVAMTFSGNQAVQTPTGNYDLSVWLLASPTLGTNNIVVSGSSGNIQVFSESLSNAYAVSIPDAINAGQNTSMAVTSVANQSLPICIWADSNAFSPTAPASITARQSGQFNGSNGTRYAIGDLTAGPVGIGTTTTFTAGNPHTPVMFAISFAPLGLTILETQGSQDSNNASNNLSVSIQETQGSVESLSTSQTFNLSISETQGSTDFTKKILGWTDLSRSSSIWTDLNIS